MAWYRTGTVAVTNGSTAVVGTGTAFVGNALAGQGIVMPDGRIYEIAAIVSATALTLAMPYLGSNASGQVYAIVPTRGPELALAQQIAQLVADYGAAFLGAGQGLFPNGTAAIPGIRFSADTDTGMRRSGTNALALVTGGTDQLIVTTTGAVLAGLLTGTAVTQSDADLTAGRLLKVGDFGWGGIAPSVTAANALDAILTNQRTRVLTASVATVNGPAGASGGICDTYAFGSLNAYQEYREVTGAYRMWRRGWSSSSWSAWARVPNLIVGSITASGGEATAGGIIERGSNANGEFTRFADGTQICTARVTTSLAINGAHVGGFRSAAQVWTFPAAFAAIPEFNGFPLSFSAFGVTGALAPTLNSAAYCFTAITSQGTAENRVASLIAVGRWF